MNVISEIKPFLEPKAVALMVRAIPSAHKLVTARSFWRHYTRS